MCSTGLILCNRRVYLVLFAPNISSDLGLPSSPEDLHVVSTDFGSISLEWMPAKETATTPVDGYVIEMAEGDSENFVEVAKVNGYTCKFEVTNLQDGQKYNFRVKGENRAGTSERCAQLDKPAIASAVGKEFRFRQHTSEVLIIALCVCIMF